VTGLSVVSLFAGIGGIDLAAENSGMRTVLVCEKDKACRAVLARRFPEATIHDDVRTLTADDLRAAGAVPHRTVVTAGWPCQGNSVAGNREGMDHEGSGLWREVARVLAEFRPRWFVGENVDGLLSVNDGDDFGKVLQDLAELGYGWSYRVLDARYFGVPQRRARVIVVGCLGDSGAAPAEVLLEPEGGAGDSAAGGEAWSGATADAAVSVGSAGSATLSNTHTHTSARSRLLRVAGGSARTKRQPVISSSGGGRVDR
jgi:DNA (cytosine-5)-methyltransferase 1